MEKPQGEGGWINGGFFILSPKVISLIDGDSTSWEDKPLARLASAHELMAFQHHRFWQPMDTLRDKITSKELGETGRAPWQVWK